MVVDHPGRLHESVHVVGPTNLKPRAAKSFDIACDSAVAAGTCLTERKRFTFGSPPTKFHSSAEKPGPFSIEVEPGARGSDRASIFMRLRTMPASCISRSIFSGCSARSSRAESRRRRGGNFPRLRKIVIQKPGLKAVEHKLLVDAQIVALGHAPLVVMIGDVEGVLPRPRAAALAVEVEEGRACASSPGRLCLARPIEPRPVRLDDAQCRSRPRSAACRRRARRRRGRAQHRKAAALPRTDDPITPISMSPAFTPRRFRRRNPRMRPARRACAPCRDARRAKRPPDRCRHPFSKSMPLN